MRFFSTILFAAALVAGIVEATPTKTVPHVARGNGDSKGSTKTSSNDCGENEFFYSSRSCCLQKGGPSSIPTPPKGVDCPSSWYFHHGEGCCVPRSKPTQTASPTCKKGWLWSTGLQCCSPHSPPSHTATPSAKPKSKGGKYKVKRNFEQWDVSFCPTGLTMCPIVHNGVLTGDSECIDTTSDLPSCGGCASLGEGKDCSSITNASCMGGVCVVGA